MFAFCCKVTFQNHKEIYTRPWVGSQALERTREGIPESPLNGKRSRITDGRQKGRMNCLLKDRPRGYVQTMDETNPKSAMRP